MAEPTCLSQLLKLATNTLKYLRLGSVTPSSSSSSKSTCKNKRRKKTRNENAHCHHHRHHLRSDIRSDDDLHIPSELASSDIRSDDDLHIPLELASDILARLPTKEVFRYQCVCKSWRHEISTAFFMKSHTLFNKPNSSSYIILHTAYISLLSTSKCNWFYCLDFSSPTSLRNKPQPQLELAPLPRMSNILRFTVESWDASSLITVGSSNGLLCFKDSSDPKNKPTRFWICNPATGSLSVTPYLIPEHTNHRHCHLLVGFGYDSTSHDYKILYLYVYSDDILYREAFTESWVYSLKTNSWKPIIPSPDSDKCFATSLRWTSDMVYSNNALHWINNSRQIKTISFDLATEKYDEIPMPPDSYSFDFRLHPRVELVGLRGHLHLVKLDKPVEQHMEIWVMKKYRVQWTKLVCIDLRLHTFMTTYGQVAPPIPYAYTKDGKEILIGFGNRIMAFIRCNLHTGELKEVKVSGVQNDVFYAMPLDCFSLVSSSPSD